MKKTLIPFLSLLLILSFSNINAQTHFALGARAGLGFANLSFNPDVTSGVTKSSRTGFQFGAMAELSFSAMIAIQAEPMFVTGAGCQLSGAGGKDTYELSFLEIPVLVKFKVPITKSELTPYFFAGPNLVFVMSSKDLLELNNTPSKETNNSDLTSSVVFAIDFGAGAGFKVAPLITVMMDVRYSLGLSNLLNDKGGAANQSIKTNGFQIVAGVMFGL